MTLNDLKRQNRGFYRFFGDFELRHRFQEQIAPKSLQMDQDKLNIKFSALNVDIDGLSLDLLGSKKPAHESIKKRYSRKSRYFTVVSQSFVKTVADHHWHITTSISDELFISVVSTTITMIDPELPK